MRTLFAIVVILLPQYVGAETKEIVVKSLRFPLHELFLTGGGPYTEGDPFVGVETTHSPPPPIMNSVTRALQADLPGAYYDAKPLLSNAGVEIASSDIALFHPASSTFLAEMSPSALKLMSDYLDSLLYSPPLNLNVSGTLSVVDSTSQESTVVTRFHTHCRSAQACNVTFTRDDTTRFEVTIDPVIQADGMTLDYTINVNGSLDGNTFNLSTALTTNDGKEEAFLLGTSNTQEFLVTLRIAIEELTPGRIRSLSADEIRSVERTFKHIIHETND